MTALSCQRLYCCCKGLAAHAQCIMFAGSVSIALLFILHAHATLSCRAPVSPYATSKPPLAATSSVAIPRQQSLGGSAFCAAPVNMARSCPRPINMQPRRQPSFQADRDDLAGFVPPHELVACSLMDTSNVTVSKPRCCRWLTAVP
jgi:hypothetical protein